MAYRKITPEEKLEAEADRLLMQDRRTSCDCLSCKQYFYLNKQYMKRIEREIPGGLCH